MAHIPRLYLDADLQEGEAVAPLEAQSKYLTRVMRLQEGSRVRAFNGRHGEWACRMRFDGRRALLLPETKTREQVDAAPLTLVFAPLKKARTDFVVEKACELGATVIQPVLTEFTQTKTVRTDRLQTLVIEAAEQTERLDIPEVREAKPLASVLAEWSADTSILYGDEAGSAAPVLDVLRRAERRTGAVLVGPEGGFSKRERDMLRKLDIVVPVTLGPRILRAETAAVSMLTLWQSVLGDWSDHPYVADDATSERVTVGGSS